MGIMHAKICYQLKWDVDTLGSGLWWLLSTQVLGSEHGKTLNLDNPRRIVRPGTDCVQERLLNTFSVLYSGACSGSGILPIPKTSLKIHFQLHSCDLCDFCSVLLIFLTYNLSACGCRLISFSGQVHFKIPFYS